jgi:hypothetical protein
LTLKLLEYLAFQVKGVLDMKGAYNVFLTSKTSKLETPVKKTENSNILPRVRQMASGTCKLYLACEIGDLLF